MSNQTKKSRWNTILLLVLVAALLSETVLARGAPGAAAAANTRQPHATKQSKTLEGTSLGDGAASPARSIATTILMAKVEAIQEYFEDLVAGKFHFLDIFFILLACVAIGLSSSAMILEASLLVDVLAWTCIVVGSSAAVLQRKVSLLEGLRKLTNQLRTEVNKVTESNDNLRKQNQQLARSSKKLNETTTALEQISSASGLTVDKLVQQVNQYKEIQASIKESLRSKIKQTLLGTFMRSDSDRDGVIDPEEVDRLVMRLKLMPGVEFNEAKFRRTLKKEGGDMMKFADNHFEEADVVEKERIFIF